MTVCLKRVEDSADNILKFLVFFFLIKIKMKERRKRMITFDNFHRNSFLIFLAIDRPRIFKHL